MKKGNSVTFFGTYQNTLLYSRNIQIKQALIELGYEIIECQPKRNSTAPKEVISGRKSILKHLFRQAVEWLSLLRHTSTLRRQRIIIVPYPSHLDILLLRLLVIGKKPVIIMDAFLGLYDTIVRDRQLIKSESLLAEFVRWFEKFSLSLSDKVLIDTPEQEAMLSDNYQLEAGKCVTIPVGIDEQLWQATPVPAVENEYRVYFWGTFIPLHGIESIVEAAQYLEPKADHISITLIGTGQTAEQVQQQLSAHWPKNLHWENTLLDHEALIAEVTKAHCVLGIFGQSEKAGNVIPYKIYQALCLNRPVITRESKTLTRDLQDYGIHTVPPGSGQLLADKILQLSQQDLSETPFEPRQYYQDNISNAVIKRKVEQLMLDISDD